MGFNGILWWFNGIKWDLPSGKRLQNELERSTMLFMGKFTISMVMFHSYVKLPEGILIYKTIQKDRNQIGTLY
jgi:hypothetical protein